MNRLSQIADSAAENNAGLQPFNLMSPSASKAKEGNLEETESQKIVPKYWYPGSSRMDTSSITIDCQELSGGLKSILKDPGKSAQLKSRFQEIFSRYGLVHIINNKSLTTLNEMTAISQLLFENSMRYSGGSNFRGKLEKNVYDTGAPNEAHLHYHHEMAYVKESTKHLTFLCKHALKGDRASHGATFVSDNIGATDAIFRTPLGQKLKEKGLCYVRKLPDLAHFQKNNINPKIVYNFWQTSFETNDPLEAAAKASKQQGLEVTWEDSEVFGRYMVTKFYISAFEYCPFSKRNLLFAAVADDGIWFDTWPGVKELSPEDRPLSLRFGDGSLMTHKEKQIFVDVYDQHGHRIVWSQGDMAFICNYRFAHGRPAFELKPGEKRELGVVLGETFTRQGENPLAW